MPSSLLDVLNSPVTSSVTLCTLAGNAEPPLNLEALDFVLPKVALPVPCKATGFKLTDPQGRSPGPDGVLYVVPPAKNKVKIGGDKLSMEFSRTYGSPKEAMNCSVTLVGGCGKHLTWSVSGTGGDRSGHGAVPQFDAVCPDAQMIEFPVAFAFGTTRLSVDACEGSREFSIYTVAGDEVEFSFDFAKVSTKFTNSFSRTFKLETRRVSHDKKHEAKGKAKVKQAWEEDAKSHRAYCKTTFEVALDPLLSASGKFQLYGIPIPSSVRDYLRAGLFLKLSAKVKLVSDAVIRRWADTREWDYVSGSMMGKASGSAALSIEMQLLDPDVLAVALTGETGLSGELGLTSKASGIRASARWTGLKATVAVSLAGGLLEYEREWSPFEESEPLQHDWPIEELFGPAPSKSAAAESEVAPA